MQSQSKNSQKVVKVFSMKLHFEILGRGIDIIKDYIKKYVILSANF